MKKLQRIQWKEKYSVGNPGLDDQHRRLFGIVNRLMDVYESQEKDMLGVLTDLTDYLSVHFSTEQDFMATIRYPGLLEHSNNHSEFMRQVMEFLDQYEKGDRELPRNVLLFLRDWLKKHVVRGDDQQYAEYYRKIQLKKKTI